MEWSLLAYLIVVSVWMTFGWPRALATLSGFGFTHDTRPLIGLGPASIFFCCIFLSQPRSDLPRSVVAKLSVAAFLFVLLAFLALDFARVTENFAATQEIAVVTLIGGTAGYLLLDRKRFAFAACVLAPSIWGFALVNPVASGLRPILDTKAFQQVSQIVDRDPDGRWAVYQNVVAANLLKAAGARVFNGTNYVPPIEDLRLLDPTSSAAPIYNRYAQIALIPERGEDIGFELVAPDVYSIKIDPKNDVWPRLGIRYIALPFAATDPEFVKRTTLVETLPDVGLWVYRRDTKPDS